MLFFLYLIIFKIMIDNGEKANKQTEKTNQETAYICRMAPVRLDQVGYTYLPAENEYIIIK